MEKRAYFITIAMQRWLAARLDFFGNILMLGVTQVAAGFRTSVHLAKICAVLSHTLASKYIYKL